MQGSVELTESLGVSIGTTNLVAARPGQPPVTRRSVLTLWDDRPAEVGTPAPGAGGIVLRGFVERVGDPVPLVAADGSAHRGEALTAAAVDAIARAVGGQPASQVVVAVPAHWGPGSIGALRGALRNAPSVSPGGVPPVLISDAAAALTALAINPGLPDHGVIALCDFGAGGSSITMADAALTPIGETIRCPEFSGDLIDQALLTKVLADTRENAETDPAGTAAVGSLTRLREECRMAKERLSFETAVTANVALPGFNSDVRITRTELEQLIAGPLAEFLDVVGDALERNRIAAASLTAVATVGGGAAIPFITQRLSEELRVPVITTPMPEFNASIGAALLAMQGPAQDATGMAPAADAPTGMASSAWAVGSAGRAASESASDGSPSATFRALAWSQDDDVEKDPVPYSGDDYTFDPGPSAGWVDEPPASPSGARPQLQFDHTNSRTAIADEPTPWYRRPPLLFGIAAAVAAISVGGLAISLTSSDSTPTTTTTRVTKPGESPSETPTPETVTITGDNGVPTVTTITPSTTVPSTTESTSSTTTTTTPTTTTTTTSTTTTTTPPTTTTTTQPPTTTTAPPTTTQPPTTTNPPTTTAAPPTTTAAPPPTTSVAPATHENLTGVTAPEATAAPTPAVTQPPVIPPVTIPLPTVSVG